MCVCVCVSERESERERERDDCFVAEEIKGCSLQKEFTLKMILAKRSLKLFLNELFPDT